LLPSPSMRSPSSPFSACELSDIDTLSDYPTLDDSVRSALILPPPGHWARGSLGSAEESSASEDEPSLPRRRKLRHRSRSPSPSNRPPRPPVRRRLTFPRHSSSADNGMANLGGNYDWLWPCTHCSPVSCWWEWPCHFCSHAGGRCSRPTSPWGGSWRTSSGPPAGFGGHSTS
jgi:hypothetical protein